MPGPGMGLLDMMSDQPAVPQTPQAYGFGAPYAGQGVYSGTPMQLPAGANFGDVPAAGMFSGAGGASFPVNWRDYAGDPSTGGGFFTLQDVMSRPVATAPAMGPRGPAQPTTRSVSNFEQNPNLAPSSYYEFSPDRPSTNNYRLLAPQFRSPDYVLRNGMVINRGQVQRGNFGPWGYSPGGGESDLRPKGMGGSGLFRLGGDWPGSANEYFWPGGNVLTTMNVGMGGYQ